MASSFLPLIDNSDPRMKLTVRNKVKNVFVTQPGSTRCKKEENVQYIPVVRESPSRLLEAGVNTLQKTLVLKKQAELDEVNAQLVRKREEFKSRMEALSQRRSELELKQQQNRETMMKFEKFVAENEAKRSQALKKHEAAKEENALKQREIEELTEQLKQLKVREQVLKEKTSKYKIYEDYLLKTLDCFPSSYLDRGSKSSVMSIIRRHETLSLTNRDLRNRLAQQEEEAEQVKKQLQGIKQEHDVKKLMDIKELSDLQRELETLKEENKQMEVNLLMEQGRSREKTEEVGAVLMAVNNLAEQCYLAAYGPLDKMNVLTMMDMVKEYILDKKETERRARRLMESQDAVASRAALTDKRGKGSMKSIGSKTQIKSSSNVSRKSEMAS